MAMIEVKDLRIEVPRKKQDPLVIVNDVSFEIERGEVLALIGESGSGKSTISLATLGYARPGCRIAGGTVHIDGTDVLALDSDELREWRGQKVSYIAQSAAAAFNPAIKIGEQVIEGPLLHGSLNKSQAEARALELYRQLSLPDPEGIGRRYPHQVSGGQLQRLMAAMALCGSPDLLVLDEPTTALDVTTQIEVLQAFKHAIAEQGTAAVYVTHDLAVVAQIADRILVLNGGEIQEMGTTEEILHNPQHPYTKKLMAAVRPPPKADDALNAREEAESGPLLRIENVHAGYGGIGPDGKPMVPILSDINLDIERASVIGVIGESGCGKSTLARVIAGLLPQAQGQVLLDGEALPPELEKRSRQQLQRIQIVFQMADVALNPRQKIGEILARPLAFYLDITGAAAKKRVGELLEMVELPAHFANRYPGELSGGQKQRINLARALAAEPDIILCDEVTSALDTVVGAAIIDLLKRLQDKLGVTYVFISHDLSTVASFADRIVVLYAGQMVDTGTTREVLSPPFHPYSHLLLSSVPEMRQGWLEETAQTRDELRAVLHQ